MMVYENASLAYLPFWGGGGGGGGGGLLLNIRLLLYLSCFYDSSNCCMGPKIVQISLNIYIL